jgi:hypothetical protein
MTTKNTSLAGERTQITVTDFELREFERAGSAMKTHNPDAADVLFHFARNNVDGSRVACAEYDEASTLYRQWLIHG